MDPFLSNDTAEGIREPRQPLNLLHRMPRALAPLTSRRAVGWQCRSPQGTQSHTELSLKESRFQRKLGPERETRIAFCLKENHFQHRQPRGTGNHTGTHLQHWADLRKSKQNLRLCIAS